MNRRQFLFTGVAAFTVAVLGGTAAAIMRPVRDPQGRFAPDLRTMWLRIGEAVLAGAWPPEPGAAHRAQEAWLRRVEDVVTNLPPHARTDLDRLLSLLRWDLPRRWILDLTQDWPDADAAAVLAALQRTNRADSALRQQSLSALRDLSLAAYYADPSAWEAIGYPGPNAIST